ncbi:MULTISPECIES: terminase [unclassified Aeromonas]|uniref:terminase n=1 Tax=unclassified Aeromonas TaxID=257493 RepID=UPI00084AB7EE|nr:MULTISPECIES: terminase [unclassified Aeromonas]OEC50228.1 terminase [Aeromonas sp. ANNP30]OEC62637.1 terminase [Aeromonas sp. ANP5]
MARIDWLAMQEEFTAEHAASGISVKEWCEKQGLNYQSARRHIKFRTAQTAHSDVRNAQSAQSKVRTIAHSEKNAQPKGNEAKARGGEGGERKSSSPPHASADSGQKTKNKGRDDAGRFVRGEYEGNPNPQANIKPGMQIAKTHGGYAQFLDAPELFDQAEELRLRDELIFTRARVISVTKTLKALQQDLAAATEMADRLALYEKLLKAEQALDRNIQRIESIERTLSTMRIDEVTGPKIEADTKRIEAATRKLTAEADRLEKDGGSESTPVSEMVSELQGMGTGGLMS